MFPSKKFMLSGSLDSGGASVPVAETVEFSDFFDGPVPKYFNGGTWKVVGGRLVNVPIVGNTMLTNGDMENWSNDTTLTGWTNSGVGVVKDQTNQKSGSSCARVDVNASNTGSGAYINPLQAVGTWSYASIQTKSSIAGKTSKLTFQGATRISQGFTSYEKLELTGRAVGSNYFAIDRNSAASSSLYFDEAFAALLDTPSLFLTANTGLSDVRIIAECLASPGFQIGVVTNLDNPLNPQNFLLAYVSLWNGGQNINLIQRLNGTYTSLISVTTSGATVIGQDDPIEIRVVGNVAQLFYKSMQIDTNKTIDSSLTAFTNQGFFSTSEQNSFKAFYIGDPTHVVSVHTSAITPSSGAPDHSIDQEPTVIFHDNTFMMWYSQDSNAYGRDVGYAESSNGESWTPYASNPVLSGATRSFVLLDGSTFVMYTGGASIERWTSSDGKNWTHTGRALEAGSGSDWDADGLQNMFVFKDDDGLWKMLFESHASKWWIGLATSPDNINWTKSPGNPILGGGVGSYSAPHIVKVDGVYYGFYHGNPTANLPTDIYCVKSLDLRNWKRCINNFYRRAITNEGPNSASGQVADVNLVEVNGSTYLYFTCSADQVTFSVNQAKALVPLAQLVK